MEKQVTYNIVVKQSFLKDFIQQNRDIQERVEKALKNIAEAPDEPRGNTVKKLSGFKRFWRYRIGDYRLVYEVYPKRNSVRLLMLGARKNIYDRLNYNPEEPDLQFIGKLEDYIDPDSESPVDWQNYERPQTKSEENLTFLLTAPLLKEWKIPEEFIPFLSQCRTADGLLNCDIPPVIIDRVLDHIAEPDKIEDIAEQPSHVITSADDLKAFSNGEKSLSDFLLYLDEDQEDLVSWAINGPTLVKGGAGSGKSTIALYRVKALVAKAQSESYKPRILFTTYTNALVNYSSQLLSHLVTVSDGVLTVSTVDKIARKIVNDFDGSVDIADDSDLDGALNSGIVNLEINTGSALEDVFLKNQIKGLREAYLLDEINWVIEGRGLKTEQDYLQVDRTGRGYALNVGLRKLVWQIYKGFYGYLHRQGKMTWGGMRNRALAIVLGEDCNFCKYDYVLIDEAQDLTPIALSLCAELAADPTGIFLTADSGQSLYNKGFSWSQVNERLQVRGRTRILKRNYRTTRQIAEAANEIIRHDNAGDQEVLDQFFMHAGPKPIFFEAFDEGLMVSWMFERINTLRRELLAPFSATAVICPTQQLAKRFASLLTNKGLPTKFMNSSDFDLEGDFVKAITVHTAKGLEFPIVALPYLEDGYYPAPLEKKAKDRIQHMAQQRRLLYVASSRAMRRLIVSYRTGHKSPFLENLSNWEKGELQ